MLGVWNEPAASIFQLLRDRVRIPVEMSLSEAED
jgi:hypothetical protein